VNSLIDKHKKDRKLEGVETELLQQGDDIIQKSTQQISPAFLDDLKDARSQSNSGREGEFMRVASIPTAVAEQWQREGFNIYEESGKAIVRRLRAQNLDAFLATDKRI